MYPSIKTLMQIKDVTRADAIAIRAIMAGPRQDDNGKTRMQRIDAILNTCGVEVTPVLKVNGTFRVGCWGDIVERGNYD
jgi:hypothetical protein